MKRRREGRGERREPFQSEGEGRRESRERSRRKRKEFANLWCLTLNPDPESSCPGPTLGSGVKLSPGSTYFMLGIYFAGIKYP